MRYAIVAAVLVATPARADTVFTFGHLMISCRERSQTCISYVTGFIAGHAHAAQGGNKPKFCMLGPVEGEKIVEMFEVHVNRQPSIDKVDAASGVAFAFEVAFPCKR